MAIAISSTLANRQRQPLALAFTINMGYEEATMFSKLIVALTICIFVAGDFIKPALADASLQVLNQQRYGVGLPPLTGNLQRDVEILQFECQHRIKGSCIVLQRIKNWITTYEAKSQQEEARNNQESCYEMNYRWGRCAALEAKGYQCRPEDYFVMPEQCRFGSESDRGFNAGWASGWNQLPSRLNPTQGSGFTGGGSTSDDSRHQRELERWDRQIEATRQRGQDWLKSHPPLMGVTPSK